MHSGKNDKKEKNSTSGCFDGMAERMTSCFPNSATYSDCCAWMKEIGEKFCRPEQADSAKEENRGSCFSYHLYKYFWK